MSEQIINHQEALQLAYSKKEESNLARCYLEQYQELLDARGSLVAHGHNNDYCKSELSALRKELEEVKKMSMCELMTINASAKEYAEHWESRTLKAEAERDRLAAQISEYL